MGVWILFFVHGARIFFCAIFVFWGDKVIGSSAGRGGIEVRKNGPGQ